MRITDSARRHGVSDDDITHVIRNAIRVLPGDGFEFFIGADNGGRLLEVGVRIDTDGELIAFHAMPARPKFLR